MASGPFYRDDDRPFLQRDETMALDVIRPKDVPKGKVMYPKDKLMSLETNDIYKAKPHYEHLNHLNKPDFSVGCTDPDHAGGRARSYYMPMDRRPRDLSLTTADIELAQPKASSWKGNRHVDPVCPNYEMPSYVKREPTPPRWNGRHTNDISDIDLTQPRVLHPDRNYVRDPNDARDIEYASANYRERLQRQSSFGPRPDRTFNVQDINQPKQRQPRSTNPLDPVYKVPTSRTTSLHAMYNEERSSGIPPPAVQPTEHGEVHGSKPRKLQWDNGEPHLSLLREDIPGAVPQRWVGSVPQNIYDPPEVRPMVSFHDPGDIPGTQVGSLRRGIASHRQVNPLNPRYTMLDGDQKPPAAPVIEAERQMPGSLSHPMLRSQAAASSLPNLRAGAPGHATPSRMQRDTSEAMPRSCGGSSRPSRGPSGACTPTQRQFFEQQRQQGGSGYQLLQQGSTLKLPPEGGGTGELSRRSAYSGSSQRSFGRHY